MSPISLTGLTVGVVLTAALRLQALQGRLNTVALVAVADDRLLR